MKMSDKKIISLDKDAKEVCLSAIKDISSQLSFMYDLIKTNKLDEEMRDTLSNLFEYRMRDISKKTGYDGLSTKVVEEKHKAIREANLKIRELEKQIGSEDLTDKIQPQIKYLSELISKWWDIEGFNYIREMNFGRYGVLEVELGFSFNDFSSRYSDKPVTKKEQHKTWIEEVKERGFAVAHKKGDGYMLVDCESNRQLLISMIKNKFPSAKITKIENYRILGSDEMLFQIRGLTLIIKDIREIKNLESYISKFHEIEDEY